MGLCVFFLICGPLAALRFSLSQTLAEEPTPAATKGLNAIRWTREADEHLRNLKRAA